MDVQMPDGTVVRGVPDGMSKADLLAKLHGNGIATGIEPPQGATSSHWDVFKNALAKGASGAVDSVVNTPANIADIGNGLYVAAKNLATGEKETPELDLPRFQPATNAATAVGAIDPKIVPQGKLQNITDFAGQALGGAAVGGGANSIVRNTVKGALGAATRDATMLGTSAVAGGAGVEGAKQIVPDMPFVQQLAGMAASMIAGAPFAVRSTAGENLNAAIREIPPDKIAAAQSLWERARAAGTSITPLEALQQTGGANPVAAALQRVTEASAQGGPKLAPMMADRAVNNATALESALPRPVASPDQIAPNVARAAEGAIDTARQGVNAQAAPFYAAAEQQKVPANTWNSMVSDPAMQAALAAVKKSPLLGLENEQPGSLRWLDMAKKYLNSSAEPSLGADAIQRTSAAAAGNAAGQMSDILGTVNPDYGRALAIGAAGRQNVVNPMMEGLPGKLAGTGDLNSKLAALIHPGESSPALVAQTMRQMGPAANDMLVQGLRARFDAANKGNIANSLEGNPWGGAKFASDIAGNKSQAANVDAALQALSPETARKVGDLLQIFGAQGKRQAPGSPTSQNAATMADLAGNASSFKPMSLLLPLVDKWRYGSNTKMLGDLLANKDVHSVMDAARIGGATPGKLLLLQSLLNADNQMQGAK